MAVDQDELLERVAKETNPPEETNPEPSLGFSQATNRGMRVAEDAVYAVTALILVAGALAVLFDAGYSFATGATDNLRKSIESALEALLIVFILVELLGAVRETISERKLVAEPFLLVGVIAAIKEIVVVSSFEGKKDDIQGAMLEIGVLGAVIVALSVAMWLLRRKEREPDE